MKIEIPDHQAAALNSLAAEHGLSLIAWLGKLAEEASTPRTRGPRKTNKGSLSKYSAAPSAQEIDHSRDEMLGTFAREF